MKEVFIKFLNILNDNDSDYRKISQKLYDKINNQILSEDLRQLIIYFIDDYYIQKSGNLWINYMLEFRFYKTQIGGEKFYNNLDNYFKTSNLEFIELYALAISFNFLGKYSSVPRNIIERCIISLNIKPRYLIENKGYNPINITSKSTSLLWMFFSIGLLILILNIIDYLSFKYNIFDSILRIGLLLKEKV